jgi:transcriptional regulator with XRE-family HTH domain
MIKPNRVRSTATIDDHVAARIRERRSMLGLNQRQLGGLIGVSCQRMHAYERGINRVSVGRLYEIACALNVPIAYFYEGLGEKPPQPVAPDQRMLRDTARNFAEIKDKRVQGAFNQLARVLATLNKHSA